jgi:benzoylformate decarboxylase
VRELVHRYLERSLSRRGFVENLTALGFTAAAAQSLLRPLDALEASGDKPKNPASMTTLRGTGGELCVAQAKAAGVEYLFTNPGSFEVGFFDAFVDTPGMHLIMGLHEGIVISMADGYHRVSGKPAFVNVHAVAGTAQMGGQLYNAARDGSALVITAGLNDNEQFSDESVLAPRPGFDQKDVPRQFTKIAWEVRNAESIPVVLRRAFKVATTDPGGPVYLAMAHYALETKNASGQILPADRFMLRARMRPEAAAVEKAAKWLMEAQRPVLIVGDEIWKAGAQPELIALSEKLGLAVTAGNSAYRNFPAMHPHNLGAFNMSSDYVAKGPDLIVFVGARDLGGKVLPATADLPSGTRILRIGSDTASMGRNYPTDLALVGDVKDALSDLMAALGSPFSRDKMQSLAASRSSEIKVATSAMRAKITAGIQANFGHSPMHPDELGYHVARNIPPNSIIASENLTGKYDSFPFGYRDNEMMWLGNSGASLGWGIGASIGAALAAPNRPAVCCIGDGSVMYSASGFWTQARYSIPVLTIVWNNHNYQTVRHAYYAYKGRMAASDHYAAMHLGDPNIDFVKLAESQGVSGERVESAGGLDAALKRGMKATTDGKPYVIDVEIARYGGGASSTWYEKFSLAEKRKQRG